MDRRLTGHLLAGGLLVHLAAIAAELAEPTETIPWRPLFGHGVWQIEGGMALVPIFSLRPEQQQLAIEIEAASAVLYHPDGGVREAQGTGGGRIAAAPKQVEVFIDVAGTETTAVSLWYRVRRVTAPGHARFLQGIDASLGAAVGWVDVNAERGEWTWVRARQRPQLRPHRHELQLTGIPPGVEWDQLVISRDHAWKPPDSGPLPATSESRLPTRGTVTTADAMFPEVRQWRRVALAHVDRRGGKVALEVSIDRGQTWQAAPVEGSLETIAARGDGTDRIRVRATLTRDKDGPGPLIGQPELTYATPTDATFAVDGKQARWTFARRTGALCGIEHRPTGTALMPVNRPVPLFEMRLKPPGHCPDEDWVDLNATDARCLEAGVAERPAKGSARRLRFRYRVERDDGSIDVVLHAAFKPDGEAQWNSELTNGLNSLEVVEFAWPILDNVKTTDQPETDQVLLGGCYLFAGPSRVGRFFYSLPGTLLMPMLDLSGADEGITLVSHDPTYRNVMMSCAGQREAGVRLSLHKVLAVKPGQRYDGPPNVVRVHAGDWRQACLLERPHARELYPAPTDMLPSVRDLDGLEMEGWSVPRWDRFGHFARRKRAQNGFNHLGLWNFQVPKTYWNTPHPNPIMGNAEDLKWAIRAFRRSGMRIAFYIQSVLTSPLYEGLAPDKPVGYLKGRHLWPGWDPPPAGWNERHRSRRANGKGYVYSRQKLPLNIPMAHGSQGFHDYKWAWAVERFGREIGLDGVYWDSNSNAQPSWGTNDRYAGDPGLSAVGLLETQRAINKAYTDLRPGGLFTFGEGSPNAFMHQVRHVHLANAYSLYPIRMLFPEMVLVPGGANNQDQEMHKTFLAGARLYGSRHKHKGLQKAMVAMRRKVSQYLYPAAYRHDVDLAISDERVQATLSLCAPARTRGAVLNILNLEQVADATITVDTRAFGPVRKAWVIDSDGREERLPLTETEAFRLPAPTARASHILLFNRAEPRVAVELDGELAEGSTIPLRVTLESLDGNSLRGLITLRPPAGLHAPATRFRADTRTTVTIPLSADLGAVNDIFDIPLEIRLDRSRAEDDQPPDRVPEALISARAVTLYVHEPITWELEQVGPEQVRLRLQNRTTQTAALTVNLQADKGPVRLAGGPKQALLSLAASERKALFFDLDGAAAAQRPWRLRGEMRCRIADHEQQIEMYRQFWPVIANGSLEFCEFRHDAPESEYYVYAKTKDKMVRFMRNIPDYWWGLQSDRSPKVTHHEGLTLDEETPAADGKRSFRLAAGKRARANLVLALTAGTRYRVSAALRASRPGPGCSLQFGNTRLRLTAAHAPDTWHTLSTELTATLDGGSVYFFTSDDSVTWFDSLNAVPLSAPGEATQGE